MRISYYWIAGKICINQRKMENLIALLLAAFIYINAFFVRVFVRVCVSEGNSFAAGFFYFLHFFLHYAWCA
jgi:hypothetical protein